jgi:hypothetical protein
MSITVSNPLWLQVGLVIGVPLFAAAGGYCVWFPVDGGFQSLVTNIILFASGVFCLFIVPTGITLLRFMRHVAILEKEGIELRVGPVGRHLRWNEIGRVKFQPTLQVLKLYDLSGQLVYAVDYYAKNFSALAVALQTRLSNAP